ncbi:MAG: DNA primase [Candidatus Omnitrophota bacterium]
MTRFSEQVLGEILERCDIVETISQYFPLKKIGRNFKACCPFHHEKTPSFIVSPEKQIFHCFGCGAGGDVFGFVMKQERLSFPETVRFVAKKVGFEIKDEEKKDGAPAALATLLFKINELASWYFHRNLTDESWSRDAREYLMSRKVDKESIAEFRIGFASQQWDGLINYLRGRGIQDDLILKAGLAIKGGQGRLYDRFRNRIIFPIFNLQSKIVGFGGRIMVKDTEGVVAGPASEGQPKYINSPETEIYKKSRNLYGFNFSKDNIRREDCVVIVEGYLDFIIPFQYGLTNIVASLGTAFTLEHTRLLRRYTQNIIIVFDPDVAGQDAALRSLDLLVEEGLNVTVAELKAGFDPDTFMRKFGKDAFIVLLESAKSLFDYKLSRLFLKYNKDKPEGKAVIANEMLVIIKKIKNAILRAAYIKKLSGMLSIPEEALLIELQKIKTQTFTRSEPKGESPLRSFKISKIAEQMLISLMFEDGTFIERVKKSISCEEFSDPLAQKIARHLFDNDFSDTKPVAVLNRINDQVVSSFVTKLLMSESVIEDKEKSFIDCIRKIKKDKIQTELNVLKERIDNAQKNKQGMEVLLRAYHSLKKEKIVYEKAGKEENKEKL